MPQPKPKRQPSDRPTGPQHLWVSSDRAPNGNGVYVTTVSLGDDITLTLTRDQAVRYVTTVVGVAERAVHDAAVLGQLCAVANPANPRDPDTMRAAAVIVAELRNDRPPLDDAATRPLLYRSGVSGLTGKPFVQVAVPSRRDGAAAQLDITNVYEHAMHVLTCAHTVDLDAAYYRLLRGQMDTDDNTAAGAVADLGSYRDDDYRVVPSRGARS
jgi:hypothetical protein